MYKKTINSLFLLISFSYLSSNFANAMQERDNISFQTGLKRPFKEEAPPLVSDSPAIENSPNKKICPSGEEDTREKAQPNTIDFHIYTHSHLNNNTSEQLRALYVGQRAEISYNAENLRFPWKQPIWEKEDNIYIQLIKEIFETNNLTPDRQKLLYDHNHLLVRFGILYEDQKTQKIECKYIPLQKNEILENYCSKPSPYGKDSGKRSDIDSRAVLFKGEGIPELVTKGNSGEIDIDSEDGGKTNKEKYPIFKLLDADLFRKMHIRATFHNYPHSEIAFLNRLYTDNKLLSSLLSEEDGSIRGLIIKLYSLNDNCSGCQEAICAIRPHLIEKINQEFHINIPVYFTSININPYSQCCVKRTTECETVENLTSLNIDNNSLYIPYNGTIEKTLGDSHPNLFIMFSNSIKPDE